MEGEPILTSEMLENLIDQVKDQAGWWYEQERGLVIMGMDGNQIAGMEIDTKSAWQHCNEAFQMLGEARSSLMRSASKAQGENRAYLYLLASFVNDLELHLQQARSSLEDDRRDV